MRQCYLSGAAFKKLKPLGIVTMVLRGIKYLKIQSPGNKILSLIFYATAKGIAV
jgi:hypothetical protein